MNSNLATEKKTSSPLDPRLAAAWRWLPLLIIVAAAFAYYGSYWKYWFNPHDEGGTACLIAQRLMNGERPWVDVEPGYNIGWFYPLIALFKVTGVNYLAARAWFFVLSTIAALLGYAAVTRVSGSRMLGLVTGLLLVMLPGSQFKNYIQLAQVANTACLILLVFVNPANSKKWLGAVFLGGLVIGLTFLVRVELGFFFSTIWVLMLLAFLLDRRVGFLRRFGSMLAALVLLATGVVVAQTPVYLDLRGRGLESQFWGEYVGWMDFLNASVRAQFGLPERYSNKSRISASSVKAEERVQKPKTPESAERPAVATTLHSGEGVERNTLPRKSLSDIRHGALRDRMLAFLTFAPFVGFGVFLIAGFFGFLRSLKRGEFDLSTPSFLWLLLAGASLTTFPQFFFFRPDRPHLSEFMTGYIVAMAGCLWLLWPRGESRPVVLRVVAWAVGLFLAGQLAIFTTFAMQHPSSGTIAARTGRKAWFKGENGVVVREFKRQAASLQGIHDIVMKSTSPSDYVICFPYNPGYNVMTNRPTYLQNVYVDNATHSASWSERTMQDFEAKKPAVVIIDDRAINGTEGSRFSRWAPKVLAYLREHYTSAGKFETVEVFTRPATPATPDAPAPAPAESTPAPAAPAPAQPAPATPPAAPTAPEAPAPPVPAPASVPAPEPAPAPAQ